MPRVCRLAADTRYAPHADVRCSEEAVPPSPPSLVDVIRTGDTTQFLERISAEPALLQQTPLEGAIGHTMFTLACESGHVGVVQALLGYRGGDGCRCNTSAKNHVRLTGWDIVDRYKAAGSCRHQRIGAMLTSNADAGGDLYHPQLDDEQRQRTDKRAMGMDAAGLHEESPDIDWSRLPPKQQWRELSKGANGKVWRLSGVFPPLYAGTGAPTSVVALKSVTFEGQALRHGSVTRTRSKADGLIVRGSSGTAKKAAQEEREALGAEINTLRKLRHVNVIKAFGYAHGAAPDQPEIRSFMLLLELCHCDLGHAIHSTGPCEGSPPLAAGSRRQLAAELACALEFIHGNGVAHLDLKPGNAMLSKAGCAEGCFAYTLKLADFGLQYADGDPSPYGTWSYMAPEAYSREYGVPQKGSDVFSFGILLWELLHLQHPYYGFPQFVGGACCHVVRMPLPHSSYAPLVSTPAAD